MIFIYLMFLPCWKNALMLKHQARSVLQYQASPKSSSLKFYSPEKMQFWKNPKYTRSSCCIRNVLQWFSEWYVQASSKRAEDCGMKRGHCSSTALIESSYCSTANPASFSEANTQNSRCSGWCKRSPRANARWTALSSHCETCGGRKSTNWRLEVGLSLK